MTTRKITAYKHTCERCGHAWTSELEKPKRCALNACKSPYWSTKPKPVGRPLGFKPTPRPKVAPQVVVVETE